MTELLYLKDAYLKEFEAKAVEVKGDLVVLNATAFYPRGGGQPSDRGWIIAEDMRSGVKEVFRQENVIYHRLENDLLQSDKSVRGVLHWGLRYAHMRHHTALHIVSAVVFKLYGGLVTGGQIHHDRARLDFDLEDLNKDMVQMIEDRANKTVQEARPISAKILPREEAFKIPELIRTKINLLPPEITEVRIVEIEDFDRQADGGTHVANTREVGRIRVSKVENKGRVNKRMEIILE